MPPKAKGILYIVLAAFFFSLMTFFVKLSGDVPSIQKVFFRNIVAFVIAFVGLARSEEKFHVRKDSWGPLFLRCAFGTLGIVANFWAIDRLALADSNILNKMSPFFAIIMSYFILKERPNRVERVSVLIAFIGALFVIKPTAGIASLPALVGLGSGFCAGTAYTYVR
ncbi:MAG: DMT family transporter, partial [Clostridiales bacterium]|nr:DMT family transporter [Clostridiales bacterium]